MIENMTRIRSCGLCLHRSLVSIMTIENQWEHWWVKKPKTRNQAKLRMSKAIPFAAGSISHRHFGLSVTQLYSKRKKQTNKQKHCIGKRSLPYILLLMLPSLNAHSKQVSVGNKFTLNSLLSQKIVCLIWNGHANIFNLSLTECTKGAFLSQRVEGKLTVKGLMSSLQLSGTRSSSGMSGRATRTQSKCAIGDTSQTHSGRLA